MSYISQHIPAFVETDSAPERAEFASLAELLAIPFVARWASDPDFYKFSIRDGHLLAEQRGGRSWWVIGRVSDDAPDCLPRWDGGIYEVMTDDGVPLEIPGADVLSSCGDVVRLKDGREMRRLRRA